MRTKVEAEKVKHELIPGQSKALLQELHLLTRNGDLNADAKRKLKQINHFAKFIEPAVCDIESRHADPLLVDFGSGNSYLGFILYELFFKESEKGRILSVDAREEFLARGQKRAKTLGYVRMDFQCASIAAAQLPERVHIVTALHACDTATDEAITRGIQHKSDYLFLVPCCQAEVANLLQEKKSPEVSRHLYAEPLHKREFGSHLTNVIRVLVLRSFGYQVTVTELASWEHTAKGELIMAKRINAYDAKAKQDLFEILGHFAIKPKLITELYGSG